MLLDDHIRKNKRDTVLICTIMALLFFAVVSAVGYILFYNIYIAFLFGVPIAVVYILVTYSFSVQSVLSAARARPANPNNREEKLLIHKVEEMSIASGLPMPKVYVQDSQDINAFATGHKPENAVICATTGAIQKLKTDELEGVIGHEMSHIQNRDILVATVTIGVVGAIALISEILFYSLLFGGAGGGRGRGGGGHPILIIVGILLVILAPIFARLTYLAISRRREYLADSNGAYLTRNPEGLARALEKIRGNALDPKGSKTVAPLYIANPFKRAHRNSLWSTHPPLEERIRRLRSMQH